MTKLNDLVKLQDIDAEVMELEELKGDLPYSVNQLKSQLSDLDESLINNESRMTEIEKNIRHIKSVEKEYSAKIEKLQNQLYLIKTNREYDALSHEIDHLKSTLDQEELTELELSDESDRLTEQVKIDKIRLKELSGELEDQEKKLEKTTAITKNEYDDLMSQRKKHITTIDSKFLTLYNRIHKARDGVVVVPIDRNSCGGCHSRLTSQTILEVREENKIIQCTVCRRILFWNQ